MPFIAIRGTFHVVGRDKNGRQYGFQPDGDSIQFKPANQTLLNRLEQIGARYELTGIGSLNLRLEGLDALELHFRPEVAGAQESHQPRPLADAARATLTDLLNLDPVAYTPPRNLRIKPPAQNDGAAGYILSRRLDVHGRPVCFAFAGQPPEVDGAEVFLDRPRLRQSVNYRLVRAGQAYPLFYDTLFADLRRELAAAARAARAAPKGIWLQDRSNNGLQVANQADLEQRGVIFPKLYRRLTEYFAAGNAGLTDFLDWLAATEEQVQEPTTNFTHFDNVVEVQDGVVRLKWRPEELVFISAK